MHPETDDKAVFVSHKEAVFSKKEDTENKRAEEEKKKSRFGSISH